MYYIQYLNVLRVHTVSTRIPKKAYLAIKRNDGERNEEMEMRRELLCEARGHRGRPAGLPDAQDAAVRELALEAQQQPSVREQQLAALLLHQLRRVERWLHHP